MVGLERGGWGVEGGGDDNNFKPQGHKGVVFLQRGALGGGGDDVFELLPEHCVLHFPGEVF